jgi:hypothetical protein
MHLLIRRKQLQGEGSVSSVSLTTGSTGTLDVGFLTWVQDLPDGVGLAKPAARNSKLWRLADMPS